MIKKNDINQIVTFRMIRSSDGSFKISALETTNRTKHMVALDKGLKVSEVKVGKNLKADLNYSDRDKKDLKGLIDNRFFVDVDAISNINDLVKATTVGDLSSRIFKNYIPARFKKNDINQIVTFRMIRSTDGTFKITALETMNRTKRMVALAKGLKVSQVSVRQKLKEDLSYSDRDKKDLKGLIDIRFFMDVEAISDINDLVEATTVGDLSTRIFDKYIPARNRL